MGKILPYAILSLFDTFTVIAVGHFWFGVPVRGSLLLIALLSALFLLSGLGIGLFASTIANTQQEAMLTVFMTLLPAIFLSGFFFPLQNMPRFLQFISYFIPLRYFLKIIRVSTAQRRGHRKHQDRCPGTGCFRRPDHGRCGAALPQAPGLSQLETGLFS